jgi:hypothetical protein
MTDQMLWNEALYGNNDGLLSALVEKEPPGISLVEMAGYVNGLYRRGTGAVYQERALP